MSWSLKWKMVRYMSNSLTPMTNDNLAMMTTIASNGQTLDDIKNLTSDKVTDQLKVFLIAQARNELSRVVKLTKFLDKLESQFISKATGLMDSDDLSLKQYSDIISITTSLLSRSNTIISEVLKDDSLMMILNTTIYSSNEGTQQAAVAGSLKDAQSRERVRSVISAFLNKTREYSNSDYYQEIDETKKDDENNEYRSSESNI